MKALLRASVNFLPYGLRRQIKNIPGVAWLQRYVVKRFMSDASFVHTINAGPAAGLRFEITLPGDKSVWTGTYESEFTEAIAGAVQSGDVCYDIGGFRGYMSGAMACAGASQVVVFEPLPANNEALRILCDLNPNLPLKVMPIAVGNVDGHLLLKVMQDSSMGKLETSTFQKDAATVEEIRVSVRRLDTLVEGGEIPPPNLMKIDVEGAELDVLHGCARVLEQHRPRVFIEAHSSTLERKCSEILQRLNYETRRLESNPGGDEQQRHLICVPR